LNFPELKELVCSADEDVVSAENFQPSLAALPKLEKFTLYAFRDEGLKIAFMSAILGVMPQLKVAVEPLRGCYDNFKGNHVLPEDCGQLKLEHFCMPPYFRAEDVAKLPNVIHISFKRHLNDVFVSFF